MVRVRLFGMLRLDSGVKELWLEDCEGKDLRRLIAGELKRCAPGYEASEQMLRSCLITVNGKPPKRKMRLTDGDEVCLFPPAAGG